MIKFKLGEKSKIKEIFVHTELISILQSCLFGSLE